MDASAQEAPHVVSLNYVRGGSHDRFYILGRGLGTVGSPPAPAADAVRVLRRRQRDGDSLAPVEVAADPGRLWPQGESRRNVQPRLRYRVGGGTDEIRAVPRLDVRSDRDLGASAQEASHVVGLDYVRGSTVQYYNILGRGLGIVGSPPLPLHLPILAIRTRQKRLDRFSQARRFPSREEDARLRCEEKSRRDVQAGIGGRRADGHAPPMGACHQAYEDDPP